MTKTLKKLFLLSYILAIFFSTGLQIMGQTPCPDAGCPDGTCIDGTCVVNNYGNAGIDCGTDGEKLINGQCKFNIYRFLGIRKGNEDMSAASYIQDIFNGATMFIGTVVTIALVYSGFMYVYSGMTGAETSTYKKGVMKGLLGILIVAGSYAIIRLVQFLAKGG